MLDIDVQNVERFLRCLYSVAVICHWLFFVYYC